MFSEFLGRQLGADTVEHWLIALGIVVGCVIASRLFYFISTKVVKPLAGKARGRFLHILVDMVEEPLAVAIVVGGFAYAERWLTFAPGFDAGFTKVVEFALILDATWLLARLLDNLIDEYLLPFVAKSESKLDDQVMPIVRNVANILIWAIGGVVALSDAGYNVSAIIAGLGIGGLAFAFAAQETIANLFGGVTIFIDAPFVIGDRIKVNGFDGWVREIGLRTSRLETLDGRRLSIPNSAFSKSVIENVSSEPATKVVETLGLSPTTGAEGVERALAALKAILGADPDLEPTSTAFFGDFAESSLQVTLVLWVKKGADLGAVRTRINLAVLRDLGAAGLRLALPARHIISDK